MSPPPIMPPGRCPEFRVVLNRIGDRWSVMIVSTLGRGPRRFADLRRSLDGISQRMLTLTLRALERDGLVRRTVDAAVAPGVEYALTDLGVGLHAPILALRAWSDDNHAAIREARARYDARAPSGP